jgi:transcriptional regulator with XRE-family HTH domain
MSFANRVRVARERRGWTQEQLAAKFGITKQAVYAWEKDKDKPAFEKLPRLAEVLQVPIRWLLAGSGEPPEADALESLIDALTPPQRAAVIGIIEMILPAEPAKRQARQ